MLPRSFAMLLVVPAMLVALIAPSGAAADWNRATLESAVFGHAGPIHHFDVRVEAGVDLDPDAAAREVLRALDDNRSWIGIEDVRFQLTTASDVDFTISVASPATTDRLCRPLNTVGRLSCRQGRNVVLNADRWHRGPDVYHSSYADNIDVYRLYLINHEVGHFIDKGHVRPACSSTRRAPVMMQQTFGLRGCAINGWPQHDSLPTGPVAETQTSLAGALRELGRPVR